MSGGGLEAAPATSAGRAEPGEVPPPGRFWGWGPELGRPALPAHARALLEREIGLGPGPGLPRPELAELRLPDPGLGERALAGLRAVVGAEHVSQERAARVAHAAGKSYPDLVKLRLGDAGSAPDAVVRPDGHEEVAGVLEWCADEGVAVVPFGGGTSVVGGVEPLRGRFSAVVSLDLGRMRRVLSVDRRSLTATLEPGLTGREVEGRLAAQGLTLGHVPQSFEYATVGGFAATRSSGQASTGYGRFDELVLGLRCATPAGDLRVPSFPASAAGPSLLGLMLGSEGVLGVLTEVTVAVRPLPETRRFEGWSFRSLAEGVEAFRRLIQADAAPDVARLSDPDETRLSFALAASGSTIERAGKAYLRVRGHGGGCLAVLGWEGDDREVARRRRRGAALLRAAGGVGLGTRPGQAWAHSRYAGPYLRDDLLDLGVVTETLETATSWSNLAALHRRVGDAVRGALGARGTPPLVGCHVSHLYRSGASLYFTVLARRERGAELEQWQAAKAAASEAIVTGGGTITHHHAVGRDHRPWLRAEAGEVGVDVLRAVKDRLDPAGIMNPGKLVPGG